MNRPASPLGARLHRAKVPMVMPMQDFIHRKNLENYRRLLAGETPGDAERTLLLKLLAEERAKDRPIFESTDKD